jgi:hypothetical protein
MLRGNPAHGADPVVEHHRLLELHRHHVGERAHQVVGRRARREGHHDANRLAWIRLRVRRCSAHRGGEGGERLSDQHDFLLNLRGQRLP